jgi:hypothetical protein
MKFELFALAFLLSTLGVVEATPAAPVISTPAGSASRAQRLASRYGQGSRPGQNTPPRTEDRSAAAGSNPSSNNGSSGVGIVIELPSGPATVAPPGNRKRPANG